MASQVAPWVKNQLAMQEMQVRFLAGHVLDSSIYFLSHSLSKSARLFTSFFSLIASIP